MDYFVLFLEPETVEPTNPIDDESTKRIARQLIDDFGFTEVATSIATAAKLENTDPTEPDVDPFDTSYIDLEAVKSGNLQAATGLLKGLDLDQTDIDPFDTTFVDTLIAAPAVSTEQTTDSNNVRTLS